MRNSQLFWSSYRLYFTGLHYLTFGQRVRVTGKNVAMFVAKKDTETNNLVVVGFCTSITPDKRGYPHNIFLISP